MNGSAADVADPDCVVSEGLIELVGSTASLKAKRLLRSSCLRKRPKTIQTHESPSSVNEHCADIVINMVGRLFHMLDSSELFSDMPRK